MNSQELIPRCCGCGTKWVEEEWQHRDFLPCGELTHSADCKACPFCYQVYAIERPAASPTGR